MSKSKPFTAEQIQLLSQNPYTHNVTPNRINFTIAFKEFFYEQTKDPAMTTKKILAKAGYDPSFFHKNNLDQIRRNILHEATSPEGFKSPRGLSTAEKIAQFAEQDLSKQETDATIKQLQERIVHLEYQVEFLKKTASVRNRSRSTED